MLEVAKKYDAKLVDAGLSESKDGGPQAFLSFEIKSGDQVEKHTWWGSLKSEKAQEFTGKTIFTAGFRGGDFEDLKLPMAITFIPADLTVEFELSQQGKMQIKWVNEKRSKKEFTGTAPKQAGLFAKLKAGSKNSGPVPF